jgi:hypothetical protein
VPRPDEIIRRFRPEFEKLLLITLMEDWESPITAADAAATLERYTGDDGVSPIEGHITHGDADLLAAGVAAAPPRSRTKRPGRRRGQAVAGDGKIRGKAPQPLTRRDAAPAQARPAAAAVAPASQERRSVRSKGGGAGRKAPAPKAAAQSKRPSARGPAASPVHAEPAAPVPQVRRKPSVSKNSGKAGRKDSSKKGSVADGFAAALAAFRSGDED